jgi:hypothetical protein
VVVAVEFPVALLKQQFNQQQVVVAVAEQDQI